MALTPEQLEYVRSEIGSDTPPTDADLNTIYGEVATSDDPVNTLITRVLNSKLADLLNSPDSFSVPGQYSESNAAVIRELSSKVKRFEATRGGQMLVGKLSRPDRHRGLRGIGRRVGDTQVLPS
jgi:hypothetical protein